MFPVSFSAAFGGSDQRLFDHVQPLFRALQLFRSSIRQGRIRRVPGRAAAGTRRRICPPCKGDRTRRSHCPPAPAGFGQEFDAEQEALTQRLDFYKKRAALGTEAYRVAEWLLDRLKSFSEILATAKTYEKEELRQILLCYLARIEDQGDGHFKPSSKTDWNGSVLPIRSQNNENSLFSNLLGLIALNDKKLLKNQRGEIVEPISKVLAH